jgi:hypothetical protein
MNARFLNSVIATSKTTAIKMPWTGRNTIKSGIRSANKIFDFKAHSVRLPRVA